MTDGDTPSMAMRNRVTAVMAPRVAVVLAGIDCLDHCLGVRPVVWLHDGAVCRSRRREYRRWVCQGMEIGTFCCRRDISNLAEKR